MASLAPILKQPAERRTVRFEFGQPEGLPIDAILSATVTPRGQVVEIAPLVIHSQAVGATYALLTLEDGTAGELYGLSCLVEDTGGNRFEDDLEILVTDRLFRAGGAVAAQYLTVEQFIDRVGIDEAIRLTDDKAAGQVDTARLSAALTDAESMVNSYLAVRYQVPLALPAPDPVPTLVFDLALARLYGGALPESVAERRDQAVAFLKALAAGKAALPETVAPTAASPAPVLAAPAMRVFTRHSMRGF